jgi:hypothetical protein
MLLAIGAKHKHFALRRNDGVPALATQEAVN